MGFAVICEEVELMNASGPWKTEEYFYGLACRQGANHCQHSSGGYCRSENPFNHHVPAWLRRYHYVVYRLVWQSHGH